MPDDLPVSAEVETPIQTEETVAPDTSVEESPEVETEEVDEAPAPKHQQARTVPVSALIEERRRNQSRLNALREEFAALKRSFDSRPRHEEPETDEAKHRAQWAKHLGVTELREQIQEMSDVIAQLNSKVANVDELSHGSRLAVRQYVGTVEEYSNKQYDESLPITQEQFEKMVAAEITQEDADEIFSGNYKAMDDVIKRVKDGFKKKKVSPALVTKVAEVSKVKNLPKIPGKGGVAPQAKEEEQVLIGKPLHDSAWEVFKNAQGRRQE